MAVFKNNKKHCLGTVSNCIMLSFGIFLWRGKVEEYFTKTGCMDCYGILCGTYGSYFVTVLSGTFSGTKLCKYDYECIFRPIFIYRKQRVDFKKISVVGVFAIPQYAVWSKKWYDRQQNIEINYEYAFLYLIAVSAILCLLAVLKFRKKDIY